MDHEGQDDVSPYSNLPLFHDACLECAWKCLFIKENTNAIKDDLEPLRLRGAARCAIRGNIHSVRNLNTLTYLVINVRALQKAKSINRGLLHMN